MKKGPFLLLSILVITLIFILGFQYGKRVDTAEEAMKIVLSIMPTPTVHTASEKTPISFSVFESKTCALSFVYPAALIPVRESSMSAKFEDENGDTAIFFSCDPSLKLEDITNETATSTLRLNNTNITAYKDRQNKTLTLDYPHPNKKGTIRVTFLERYRPLIEKTLEFHK